MSRWFALAAPRTLSAPDIFHSTSIQKNTKKTCKTSQKKTGKKTKVPQPDGLDCGGHLGLVVLDQVSLVEDDKVPREARGTEELRVVAHYLVAHHQHVIALRRLGPDRGPRLVCAHRPSQFRSARRAKEEPTISVSFVPELCVIAGVCTGRNQSQKKHNLSTICARNAFSGVCFRGVQGRPWYLAYKAV
eukprot:2126354-Rhodomonas_salina.2